MESAKFTTWNSFTVCLILLILYSYLTCLFVFSAEELTTTEGISYFVICHKCVLRLNLTSIVLALFFLLFFLAPEITTTDGMSNVTIFRYTNAMQTFMVIFFLILFLMFIICFLVSRRGRSNYYRRYVWLDLQLE